MKKAGRFFLCAVAFVICLLPFNAFALSQTKQIDTNAYDYYISSYNIDINVSDDNTLYVTEDITAFFNTEKHGIYRYIPTTNYVKRSDGSQSTVKAKISDIECDREIYDEYTDGDNYVIQIGNEDETLTGSQSYKISYTYSLGHDRNENFDELYFNLIGTGWDTVIENITFSINMPADFDKSKIGFSAGSYGNSGSGAVSYTVNKNKITGSLDNNALDEYEGLTVRIELPDGYFKFNAFEYYSKYAAMIIIPFAVLITVFILWFKFGRDKKTVSAVEFYPPENMNCAQVAYWYKGSISANDVVPILIELANEGFLEIDEIASSDSVLHKNTFCIKKLRDYDGNNKDKKTFFNGLFKSGRTLVYEKDLKNSFYVYLNVILNRIKEVEKYIAFDNKSLKMRILGWALSICSAIFVLVMFAFNSYGEKIDFISLLIGLIISIAAFAASFFIRRRSDEGARIKQHIYGFRMFLETAEKSRLEALADENPSYFYDILPFAYVLGVSKQWTEKFESIATQPPQWYYSPTPFDIIVFSGFMNNTIQTAGRVMTSSPQQSSGGSFSSVGSGGGFSGGGSGGGGGGSW